MVNPLDDALNKLAGGNKVNIPPADVGAPASSVRRLWINKSLKSIMSRFPFDTFKWEFTSMSNRDPIELDVSKISISLDGNKFMFPKFLLPSPAMNLNVANTIVVPHSAFAGGWGSVVSGAFAPLTRGNCWAHITRIIFDVTTAVTQVVVGPDTTKANGAPMTLPVTTGYAQEVDIWVPPGWIIGLAGTNNAGDASRDMTVIGEVVPFLNWFDYGATAVLPSGLEIQ